ncbi:MAG: (Fe-S)-binding protein [Bacteroidetes bacterium]|nr:(Fe-S)-binding protein [Bacteroidota bacterium]
MLDVEIFIPCYVDQFFPQTGWNMIKVLEKAGCKVHYNPEQTCCGQPAWNAGYKDMTKPVAEKWLNEFGNSQHPVVCPSGSCTGMIKNYYEEMFKNSSYHLKMRETQSRLFEFSEFVTGQLKFDDFGAEFHTIATYHDACGALRECRIKDAPRQLLKKVKGLQLVEMKDCENCCGFGGTFSVTNEAISSSLAAQKVEDALAIGAEVIISTDLSCLMHLDGYIRKQKLNIKTMHIADVLASGW